MSAMGVTDALVDDRKAVLRFDVTARADEMLRFFGDLIVNVPAETVGVVTDAVKQRDAHGDGPDVEVLLADHSDGFENVLCI